MHLLGKDADHKWTQYEGAPSDKHKQKQAQAVGERVELLMEERDSIMITEEALDSLRATRPLEPHKLPLLFHQLIHDDFSLCHHQHDLLICHLTLRVDLVASGFSSCKHYLICELKVYLLAELPFLGFDLLVNVLD
jgi:hypothetical protein